MAGTSVTLPALGESVTEGTVTRWLKQVGDEVAVDEPLLEVSTDKVDTEIPSPVAGTLLEIKVEEDETVEVGAELAVIGSGDAAPTQRRARGAARRGAGAEQEPEPSRSRRRRARSRERAQPATRRRPSSRSPSPSRSPSQPAGREPRRAAGDRRATPAAYVTPLVRKIAAQHGVDLARIIGTGVGGRIRKQDVLDAAAKAKDAGPGRGPGGRSRAAPRRAAAPAAGPVAAARQDRADDAAAQGHRPAHGRVAADLGPAHQGGRGRRDGHLRACATRSRPTSRPARA